MLDVENLCKVRSPSQRQTTSDKRARRRQNRIAKVEGKWTDTHVA